MIAVWELGGSLFGLDVPFREPVVVSALTVARYEDSLLASATQTRNSSSVICSTSMRSIRTTAKRPG